MTVKVGGATARVALDFWLGLYNLHTKTGFIRILPTFFPDFSWHFS